MDIAASLGIQQLKRAWTFQKRRAEMATFYNDAFQGFTGVLPPQPQEGDVHAWHLYVLRIGLEATISRDRFTTPLASLLARYI